MAENVWARPLASVVLGALVACGLAWAARQQLRHHFEQRSADARQTAEADEEQLKAFRQYAMSFSAKMDGPRSVDISGQFASATIKFHALPAPPELIASTNIHRWSYSFSKTHLYQVCFVVLVFDRPLRNFKVRAVQHQGVVPMVVSDASERTVLLQFIGDPAERQVTVDILPR